MGLVLDEEDGRVRAAVVSPLTVSKSLAEEELLVNEKNLPKKLTFFFGGAGSISTVSIDSKSVGGFAAA